MSELLVRVFISVGMNGRVEKDVISDLSRARANVVKLFGHSDIEFVDNYSCEGPQDAGRLWYLGEAIKKMGTCDYVYFTKGWENHKGCQIEMEVCKIYNIHTIREEVGSDYESFIKEFESESNTNDNVLEFGYGDIFVNFNPNNQSILFRQTRQQVDCGDVVCLSRNDFTKDPVQIRFSSVNEYFEFDIFLRNVKDKKIQSFDFKGYTFDFSNYNEKSIDACLQCARNSMYWYFVKTNDDMKGLVL